MKDRENLKQLLQMVLFGCLSGPSTARLSTRVRTSFARASSVNCVKRPCLPFFVPQQEQIQKPPGSSGIAIFLCLNTANARCTAGHYALDR